jgi:TetR/AcrR family transcriptional regulator, cholesterol catabolism regulator
MMPDGAVKTEKKPVKKPVKKKDKYRQRQTEVIDAAAAVFAKKGYHGASTGDIAALLGIAQSSLYYYFKSKDEALEKVCLHGIKGYVERLQAIVAGDGSAEDKIRGAIHNHIEPVIFIPDYFRTFVGELRYLPENRRQKLNNMIAEYNALFEQILVDGIAEKTFTGSLDSHSTMLMLIAQCNTVPFWFGQFEQYSPAQLADMLADNFLQGALWRPN